MNKIRFSLIIIFLMSFFPLDGVAQTMGLSGYDLNPFKPSRDGSGIFLNTGSKVLKWGELSLGADLHWSEGLMMAVDVNTGGRFKSFENLFVGDLNIEAGLPLKFSLGLGLPVILHAKQTNIVTRDPYSFAGIGDMDVGLKANIFENRPGSIGFGLFSRIGLPTGDENRFTGFVHPTYLAGMILDKTIGSFYLVSNIGYKIINAKSVLGIPVDDQLIYSAGLSIKLPRCWEMFGEVSGYTVVSNPTDENSPLLVLGGIKKTFGRTSVRLAGGRGATKGIGGSNWTAGAGINRQFNFKKVQEGTEKTILQPLSIQETIYFAFNRSGFPQKQKDVLDRIAELFLKQPQSAMLVLSGHADSTGPEDYNLKLSHRRAENVTTYLIQRGIPRNRITIEAYGELKPVADNYTHEGRAKNRRVEISLIP